MPTLAQQLTVGLGRSKEYTGHVSDDNGLVSLSGKTLRLRARYQDSDPDPPVISLATGTGINHNDQLLDRGGYTIAFAPSHTSGLPANTRLYYELDLLDGVDVWPLAKGTLWVGSAD